MKDTDKEEILNAFLTITKKENKYLLLLACFSGWLCTAVLLIYFFMKWVVA